MTLEQFFKPTPRPVFWPSAELWPDYIQLILFLARGHPIHERVGSHPDMTPPQIPVTRLTMAMVTNPTIIILSPEIRILSSLILARKIPSRKRQKRPRDKEA